MKPGDTDIPISFLTECFALDPTTGGLTWRERPLSHFVDEHAHLALLGDRQRIADNLGLGFSRQRWKVCEPPLADTASSGASQSSQSLHNEFAPSLGGRNAVMGARAARKSGSAATPVAPEPLKREIKG